MSQHYGVVHTYVQELAVSLGPYNDSIRLLLVIPSIGSCFRTQADIKMIIVEFRIENSSNQRENSVLVRQHKL